MEHREDEGRAAATIPTVAGRRIPTGLGGGSGSGWAEDRGRLGWGSSSPTLAPLFCFFFWTDCLHGRDDGREEAPRLFIARATRRDSIAEAAAHAAARPFCYFIFFLWKPNYPSGPY